MSLPYPWKQTAVVAAAALMATASLTVSVIMSFRLQDRIAAVQAATDLRRQLMMIATGLREAEAAQRMYVITGEEAHLAPLAGVKESLPKRWRSAVAAADRMPDFSPDLTPLDSEAMDTLESLEDTAEIRREQGREAAVQRVVLGRSYQKLVAVHMKMEALMEELEGRIEEQTRSLARAEGRGRAASLATGLVALGMGALGVWQWRQSLRHYRRELQLRAERSRAEQMAQDKSDFLAAMSHEVRTPLNAILGMSEQLRDSVPDGPAVQQAEAISTAGRSMLRIVNDLLDLSRMEAGRLDLHCSAVSPADELEWVRSLFGPPALEKGVTLELSAAADVPPVLWLDEGRFRQIMMNLAANAVKFTDRGGKVSVRLERAENSDGGELVLEVKDSGCGIPAELQSVIFQPYVQGLAENRTASQAGTGLGLAIVRQLVLLMKGGISLQSRPGAGSTFRVTLPLRTASDVSASESGAGGASLDIAAPAAAAPSVPLAEEHAARLKQILEVTYAAAAATQSTRDVGVLADALDGLAADIPCPWLGTQAAQIRRTSSAFAVSALSAALDDLPRRLAPLLPAAQTAGNSPPLS